MANRTITIDLVVNDQGAIEKVTQLDAAVAKTTTSAIPAAAATTQLAEAQRNVASAAGAAAVAKSQLIGVMATYLSAGAIAGAIKSTIDYADRLQKLSEQTGIGTTALQGLSKVANENGTSIQAVATAISAMSDRIASGDKSALVALDRLGLKVADLRKLTPDELFITIAEAIGRMPDPLEKTQVRLDLFGRTGNEVAGMMKPNLKDMADGAAHLGQVMDEQTVKSMNELRNAVSSLITTGQNLIANVLGPLAPLLRTVADAAGLAARAIGAASAAAKGMGAGGGAMFDPTQFGAFAIEGGMNLGAEYLSPKSALPALPPKPSNPFVNPTVDPSGYGGLSDYLHPQPFAKGGMVDRPTLAMLGEGGEREWVIPESKMGGTIIINAQGAHFEDESSLRRLADKVSQVQAQRYGQGVKF